MDSKHHTVKQSNVEQGPSLLPWGWLAPIIARMINRHNGLGTRLMCSPPNAVHAVAIYLLRNREQDEDVSAQTIYARHPKRLLNECWTDAHPHIYSVLKRCGGNVKTIDFYERLNTLLVTGMRDELMSVSEITTDTIRFFEVAKALDPLVLPARRALDYSSRSARSFDAILRAMRMLGLINDFSTEARALRIHGAEPISTFIEKRLDRTTSPITLDVEAPFRQIMTGRELSSIAVKFKNCLRGASYKASLGLGTHVFVMYEQGGFSAISSLERTHFCWHLDEVGLTSGLNGTPVIRQKIVSQLRQQGIDIEPQTFANAWRSILPFSMPGTTHDMQDTERW
jgi:hypothetical protein